MDARHSVLLAGAALLVLAATLPVQGTSPQKKVASTAATRQSDPHLSKEHTASVAKPDEVGPIASPCGRWEGFTRGTDEEFQLEVVVRDVKSRAVRQVMVSGRVVGIFWISKGTGSLLIVNDYAYSDAATCLIYDPQAGRQWHPDAKALAAFDRKFKGQLDHSYASVCAAAPDAARLLLHLEGHGGGVGGEQYAVVDSISGSVVRTFEREADVTEEWWHVSANSK